MRQGPYPPFPYIQRFRIILIVCLEEYSTQRAFILYEYAPHDNTGHGGGPISLKHRPARFIYHLRRLLLQLCFVASGAECREQEFAHIPYLAPAKPQIFHPLMTLHTSLPHETVSDSRKARKCQSGSAAEPVDSLETPSARRSRRHRLLYRIATFSLFYRQPELIQFVT